MDLKSRITQAGVRQSQTAEDSASETLTLVEEELPAPVTPQEQEWALRLHKKLVKIMDLSVLTSMEDDLARKQIREAAQRLIAGESMPLNATSRQNVVDLIENEILGLGPLESLLKDSTIADILVNGYDQVYVERFGKLQRADVKFHSNKHLMKIVDRIVSRVGRRIDESSPMVDARLADGSRVNVIVPPLALDGPTMSIRRFTVKKLSLEDLINHESLTEEVGQVLKAVVRARLNILVSGGTGSGKTTLLNVISGFIPENERIVTIEDSAELQLQQPHTVRLETRPPNIEGKGEITQHHLVRNSLRMRPDRIVVGEVRGEEAVDMMQAMNTGHDGSLTTIHSNSPRDALFRLENMFAMAGYNMPVKAVRAQVASAIDIVLQLERMEDGYRRLVSIQEINGMEEDVITMSEVFRFERSGIGEDGKVLGSFQPTGLVPRFMDTLHKRGLDTGLDIFQPVRAIR